MEISRNVSDEAKKRGIVGYTESIGPCRQCRIPTNVMWESSVGAVLACSKECADAYAEAVFDYNT